MGWWTAGPKSSFPSRKEAVRDAPSAQMELPADAPYRHHLILAVPHAKRKAVGWATKRTEIEEDVQAFWDQFKPGGIKCDGVEVLGTNEIALADILGSFRLLVPQ